MRKLLVLVEFVLLATVAAGIWGIVQEVLLHDKLCRYPWSSWGDLLPWWIPSRLIWLELWPRGLLFGVMSSWPALFYRNARSMRLHLLRSLLLALAITGMFWLLGFYATEDIPFISWRLTLQHTLPLFLLIAGGLYGGVAWYKNWHNFRQRMQQQAPRLAWATGLYVLLVLAALWWWQQFLDSKHYLCFLLRAHVLVSRGLLLSIPLIWLWHGWHIWRDRRSPAQ